MKKWKNASKRGNRGEDETKKGTFRSIQKIKDVVEGLQASHLADGGLLAYQRKLPEAHLIKRTDVIKDAIIEIEIIYIVHGILYPMNIRASSFSMKDFAANMCMNKV